MSNESIKTRKYYRVHNGESWDRMHFVTDANSVDANDGDNMETKVGAIKGITTSTEVTEEGYAADATTVAALNSSLVNLVNLNVRYNEEADMIQIYFGGEWVDWKGAGLLFDGYFVKNGIINTRYFDDFKLIYGNQSNADGYLLFTGGNLKGGSIPIDVSRYSTISVDYYMTSYRNGNADIGCVDISTTANDMEHTGTSQPPTALAFVFSGYIGYNTVKQGTLVADVSNRDIVYINVSAYTGGQWETRILNIWAE